MAAYASLLSLTQTLEQILNPDYECPIVIHETEQEMFTSLLGKLKFVLSFLEKDSVENNSEILKCLEGRIRDATYKAADIIESRIFNQIQPDSGSQRRLFRVTLSSEMIEGLEHKDKHLQSIVEELDFISQELVKMKDRGHIQDLPPSKSLPAASTSQSRSSNKNVMVGFHNELMNLKIRLTGSPSKLQIISITGMGGIGKTTLAKSAFDDQVIVRRFDARAWITVSQKYHVQEMLTGLLDSTRNLGRESYQDDIQKLAELLYKSLKGKRYLIVMDDVWDTKAWDEVKRFFPDDKNGSRIILTTRLSDIAAYADPSGPTCCLSLLGPEDSWKLLQQKAFGEESCYPELEEIGKDIANNCKGLPLALSVIGGLLYKSERTLDYWKNVGQNINSVVTDTDDQFTEILSLSYNHLPHHLRACFLYMGVLPENHEIPKSKLIRLWVAEGFVRPDRSKSSEEVAEKYLEDLIARNMILVSERNYIGEIKRCRIHDLMRDLCLIKASEETFLQVNSGDGISPECSNNLRRLSIHSDVFKNLEGDSYDSRLRSLILFWVGSSFSLVYLMFRFPLLRVLDALTLVGGELPLRTLEMVNLNYIALTYFGEATLPSSISRLWNLETLILVSCGPSPTVILPVEVWKMRRLRHLIITSCSLPDPSHSQKPDNFFFMENLQTLKTLKNFRCTEEALQMTPNLKKLGIEFECDEQFELSSYCIENLVHLHQLEALKCTFPDKSDTTYLDPLPENFTFLSKLKKLTLSGCRVSWKNMKIVGSVPNLEVLKLEYFIFEGGVWEPTEEEFLGLKFLLLESTNLKYWKVEETHFPILQHLRLENCDELVEIPSVIGDIPTLQVIELFECSSSAETSAMQIQEEQQGLGNEELQVITQSSDERRKIYSHSKGVQAFTNLAAVKFMSAAE